MSGRGAAIGALVIGVVLLVGGVSRAEETMRVAPGDRPSLDAMCDSLGEVDAALRGAAVVVDAAWPPSSPRGAELAERLAACLPSSGGEEGRTLRLRVERGDLVASVQRASRRSWLERFFHIGEDLDRRTLRVRLDPQLRRYVDQTPQLSPTNVVARSMTLPQSGYVGLSASTRLGVPGVLVARVDGVQLLRLGASRGRPRLELVESLDSALPVTHRRVVAQFSAAPGGYYFQRTGEPLRLLSRAGGLRVDPVNDSPCDGAGFPVPDACLVSATGRDYFDSRLQTRIGETAPPRASTSFYARFRQPVRRADGTHQDVEVVVSPRGRVVARSGDRVVGSVGYGAGMAAGDVDDDGNVEVLVSSEEVLGEGDTLRVLRVRADGSLHRVWSSEPLEGSILHATVADLDGDGNDEFLAIEERGARATLWVVR